MFMALALLLPEFSDVFFQPERKKVKHADILTVTNINLN